MEEVEEVLAEGVAEAQQDVTDRHKLPVLFFVAITTVLVCNSFFQCIKK